jgi:hypothetical protein
MSVVSVLCCQVEASATSWSLVQRSPTECGVSNVWSRNLEKRGGLGPQGAVEPLGEKRNFILQMMYYFLNRTALIRLQVQTTMHHSFCSGKLGRIRYVSHQIVQLSYVTISDALGPWQVTCQSFSTYWSKLGVTDPLEHVRKFTAWKRFQSLPLI